MRRPLSSCATLLALLGTSATAAEVTGPDSSLSVFEQGDELLVVPGATVTAAGSVQAVRFHFDGVFEAGVDRLACTVSDPAVTCAWDEDTRALDLAGPADAATFQSVARGVAYVADGVPADPTPRTIRFVGGAVHASARPTEAGDHFFEAIRASGGVTWQQAADACAARDFDGLEGYLATVERPADQGLVSSVAPPYTPSSGTSGAYWLGGSDGAVEGDWRWVTGPEGLVGPGGVAFWSGGSEANGGSPVNDSFASWSALDPDEAGPDDDHLALDGEDGQWSDRSALDTSDPVEGYVCEYGDFGTPANVDGRVASTTVFFDGCLGDAPEPTCPERDSDGDGLLNPVDPAPLDPCTPSVEPGSCAALYDTIVRVEATSDEYPVFPTVTLETFVRRLTVTLMDWSPGDPGRLACSVTDPAVSCDWDEVTGQLTVTGSQMAPELETVARGITWSSSVAPAPDQPVHVWMVGSVDADARHAFQPVHLGGQGHVYQAVVGPDSVYASAAFACIVRGTTLATVESDIENAFLSRLIESNSWLGALGRYPDEGTDREWRWTGGANTGVFWTGGPASMGGAAVEGQFTAWADGEPDGTDETLALQLGVDGDWVDAPLGDTPDVFLCEALETSTLPFQQVGSLVTFDPCGADPTGTGCPAGDDDGDGVLNGEDDDSLDPCVPDGEGLACPTGDADGDGTLNSDDTAPEDSCLPDGDALACPTGDFDGDGVPNDIDVSTDPCLPDADVLACPTGDADGDGTLNSDDTAPEDSCLPDGDALACPTGDFDGDGVPNDIDVSTDPCLPDADVLACPTGDVDGDEVENASDVDPEDPCVPDGDALACDAGDFDGDGIPNDADDAPQDSCVPDPDAVACEIGDTDGDGTPNDTDAAPEDPCVPDADALSCDTGDFDGDGLSNADEDALGLDPTLADSDGDGIDDGAEVDLGLDPTQPDTDGDGVDDDVDACPEVAGQDGTGCPVEESPQEESPEEEPPDATDEGGCATGPRVPVWWWLMAALPVLARRRQR